MAILRYLLILPAAITTWLCALLISLRVEYYRAVLLCPEEFREGSDCYSEGRVQFPLWLTTSGSALSAVCVIVTVAIVAPGNKLKVSAYTYFSGVVIATVLAAFTGELIPYLAAVITGWIAVLSVARVTDSTIAAVIPLHV